MTRKIAGVLAMVTMTLSLSGASENTPDSVRRYWLERPPVNGGVVERGEWLFRQKGCFLCHGPAGKGGVANRNYIRDTVPRLSPAQLLKLEEPEDVVTVLEHFKRGIPLDSLAKDSVPRLEVVLAQYHTIRDLIQSGRTPAKKDANGPVPPLKMPSWRRDLSPADIDAILAYLLNTRHQEKETLN